MGISTLQYQEMLARTERNKNRGPVTTEAVEVESDLHSDIITECRRRGWIALHGSMAHRSFRTIGEFDFVILADGGRVFFIEAKTRTGKLTIEQQGIHAQAGKLGHNTFIVRSMAGFFAAVQRPASVSPNPSLKPTQTECA